MLLDNALNLCDDDLALYCYEWMITFDREIDRIWRRKWTLSTWVFVITRYAGLLDVILQQLPAINLTVSELLRTRCLPRLMFKDSPGVSMVYPILNIRC